MVVLGQIVDDVDVKPDWRRLGWLIAGTKMSLANPAQPTPLNSLILGLDNPVTELLDICRCVVTQPGPFRAKLTED